MTDFEKTYQNYNPRQAALDEARALLTAAAKAGSWRAEVRGLQRVGHD